jgi:hypothetical protein
MPEPLDATGGQIRSQTPPSPPSLSSPFARLSAKASSLGRVHVLLGIASNGWWPWLLLYTAIAVIIILAVAYFVRRRRATP